MSAHRGGIHRAGGTGGGGELLRVAGGREGREGREGRDADAYGPATPATPATNSLSHHFLGHFTTAKPPRIPNALSPPMTISSSDSQSAPSATACRPRTPQAIGGVAGRRRVPSRSKK